jgi:membrane associated rhomboid family serine protease
MSWLDWLEKRLGRLAVPHLTLVVIVAQVMVYLPAQASIMAQQPLPVVERLSLVPDAVMEGEVWRLVTFLAIPPFTNMIFALFAWYFFYLMGTTLEAQWGTFRYNLFLLVGWLATVAASFLTPDLPASAAFWQGSVFLAFAYLYPEFVIQLFFLLPVRIKWLALLTWLGYGLAALFGGWNARVAIGASVLNFLLFFGRDILARMGYGRRSMLAQLGELTRKEPAYYHRCLVCGITDRSNPQMDFRYCSQCAGDCCYCMDHLRAHEHVTAPG